MKNDELTTIVMVRIASVLGLSGGPLSLVVAQTVRFIVSCSSLSNMLTRVRFLVSRSSSKYDISPSASDDVNMR